VSLGRGLSIRSLLLGAHAFVLLLPLLAVSALRIYDVALLRQTEHQLIAESVMVGEMFRAAYLAAEGGADDAYRPPDHGSGEYTPVAAQIDFDSAVGPREPTAFPRATAHPASVEAAGLAIAAQLRRAQTFNLSALRVLDAAGCVVASTRGQLGLCLDSLPEVAAALRGRYAAVLRERVSDEPPPRFGDIRRRGKVRVFTALPVFSNGRVVAVVRASRTGLDALSSLWGHRRSLLGAGLAIGLLVLGISLASAAAISRPLFRLTRAAESVARGGDVRALDVPGREPREVAQLRAVLGAMATRLDARARYVNDFASEVSHELKTPITAIRGAAELLQHGLDDMPADDRARFLANIVEDAARSTPSWPHGACAPATARAWQLRRPLASPRSTSTPSSWKACSSTWWTTRSATGPGSPCASRSPRGGHASSCPCTTAAPASARPTKSACLRGSSPPSATVAARAWAWPW
jgi:hypothetical protein